MENDDRPFVYVGRFGIEGQEMNVRVRYSTPEYVKENDVLGQILRAARKNAEMNKKDEVINGN